MNSVNNFVEGITAHTDHSPRHAYFAWVLGVTWLVVAASTLSLAGVSLGAKATAVIVSGVGFGLVYLLRTYNDACIAMGEEAMPHCATWAWIIVLVTVINSTVLVWTTLASDADSAAPEGPGGPRRPRPLRR